MKQKIGKYLQNQSLKGELIPIFMLASLFCKFVLVHLFSHVAFTQGAFLTTTGFLLLIYAILLLFSLQKRKITLYFIDLFLSVFLLAELLYMDYFRTPLKVFTFYQITNLNGLGESIFYLFHPIYLLFFLDLLLLIKPVFFKKHKNGRNIRLAICLVIISFLFILVKPVKVVWIDKVSDPFRTFDALDVVKAYGLIGHHLLDFYQAVADSDRNLTEEEKDLIEKWFAERNEQVRKNGNSPYFSFAKNKNLILIQVESFQSFVINQKVLGQEITPTINQLLKNSLYFPNIYPQTVEGNSSDAELLTQTSLYPVKQGATFFRFPNNTYHSLAHLLNQKGYESIAIHADEATFWNRHLVFPKLGFHKFYAIDDFNEDEMIGMGLGDQSMFRQTLPILQNTKQPFYSFIITLTSHVPFTIPEDKKVLNIPKEIENTNLGNYFHSIHYLDQALSSFLAGLRENGLLEQSVIVIYGDHDGIFPKDKKDVEQWVGMEISKEDWIRSYMGIPLIIYHPSLPGKTNHLVGGQIDILPTIADILGMDHDETYYMMGQNLLVAKEGVAIVPKGDYSDQALLITDENITQLPENNMDLSIANYIIKGDYFKNKKNDKTN